MSPRPLAMLAKAAGNDHQPHIEGYTFLTLSEQIPHTFSYTGKYLFVALSRMVASCFSLSSGTRKGSIMINTIRSIVPSTYMSILRSHTHKHVSCDIVSKLEGIQYTPVKSFVVFLLWAGMYGENRLPHCFMVSTMGASVCHYIVFGC